ncbi:MAG: hypothetical protein EZS28_047139, partial [Streblomastix strix]
MLQYHPSKVSHIIVWNFSNLSRAVHLDQNPGQYFPSSSLPTSIGAIQFQNRERNTGKPILTTGRKFGNRCTQLDDPQPQRSRENALCKSVEENVTNANYFNLAANSINSHLNSETQSLMFGAQVIARSDSANKDAKGFTNLLLSNKAKKTQITRIQEDIPPPKSGQRGQHPTGQGPYIPRNAAIPQATIFPPTWNTEYEIPEIPNIMTKETIKNHMRRWMLKEFDLIPVGKDDEGQYWPGFGPDVPHAIDWKNSKQQCETPSMDDIRAFWREHNFDLRVACVRKEQNSEDDSETLQPAKTAIQEFRNRFGRYRNRSLSPCNKRSRYESPYRRSQSREQSGSRGYSRSRDDQGLRETRRVINRNLNGFETR